MRIVVIGAGVIGQVYGGRLAEAGHDVVLLARDQRADQLRRDGVRLIRDGIESRPSVAIIDSVEAAGVRDLALVAVRADQVARALDVAASAQVKQVVVMCNVGDAPDAPAARLGADRTLLSFPGIGGWADENGVHYHQTPEQRTTVAAAGGRERAWVKALREAGFKVDVTDKMAAWLTVHAVMICGVAGAMIAKGGVRELAADPAAVRDMISAVGDGFEALRKRGTPIIPVNLALIFTRVPRPIAVAYWRHALADDLGTVAMEPHALATRDTEMPVIAAGARRLVGDDAPVFTALLDRAGL